MKIILILILSLSNAYSAINSIVGISVATNKEMLISIEKTNRPIVAIFISKDCPCSKGNLSYIDSLSKEYPEFKFIGIHAKKDSTLKEVKNYLEDKNISFEVIADNKMINTSNFKALKTPHAFILNTKGEIIYNGGISNSTFPKDAKEFYLKNALEDLKHNRPITVSETKAMGCFIVR